MLDGSGIGTVWLDWPREGACSPEEVGIVIEAGNGVHTGCMTVVPGVATKNPALHLVCAVHVSVLSEVTDWFAL